MYFHNPYIRYLYGTDTASIEELKKGHTFSGFQTQVYMCLHSRDTSALQMWLTTMEGW